MYINRYLIAFARGQGGKIVRTCALQLVLTLMGSMISLGAALVVRMLQGEGRMLFFHALWQVFGAMALLLAARYVLTRRKAAAAEQSAASARGTARRNGSSDNPSLV